MNRLPSRRILLTGTALPLAATAWSATTGQAALAPSAALPSSAPYVAYRDRLLAAYAEDRACRPIRGRAEMNSVEEAAADFVILRCREVCAEVLALPTSQTLDGLGLTALASAIQLEVYLDHNNCGEAQAAVAMTRAVLSVTGTPLPLGFCGFGDETDCSERDAVLYSGEGSLPAWAIAKAEAEIEYDEGEASPAPSVSIA